MTIAFPNQSRSYDGTRRAVRFWGYDSAIENSFFIEADALKRLHPAMCDGEAGALSAFDLNRDQIYQAAARIYVRRRKGSYNLVASDF